MSHYLFRIMLLAFRPLASLLVRLSLVWELRRALLSERPARWLRRHGVPVRPAARPPTPCAAVVDARGASVACLRATLVSLAAAGEALACVYVLAPAEGPGQPALDGIWPADGPDLALWRGGDFAALAQKITAQSPLCLCISLAGLESLALRSDALALMAQAMSDAPDLELLYTDAVVEEGARLQVLCKPAWDPVLLGCRNYVGEAIMVRSRSLGQLTPQGAEDVGCGLLELLGRSAVGSAGHLPMPLFRVRARRRGGYPGPGVAMPQEAATVSSVSRCSGRPRVSVIIPTRDRVDLLANCLRTFRVTIPADASHELILVDNGSTCLQAQALLTAEVASGATVLRSAGEFNYSRLVNQGAAAARGDFLLLMNNDLRFSSAGWLEEMLALGLRQDVGCVGARLLYPCGVVQHAGVVLGMRSVLLEEPIAGHAHHGWPGKSAGYFGLLDCARTVSAVTGALLLVSRQAFDLVGGFDESFAVALNDVDFCLKLGRAGLRSVVAPVRGVVHLESASRGLDITSDKLLRLRREAGAFVSRWPEALTGDPYYNPNLDLVMSFGLSEPPREAVLRTLPLRL